MLPYNDYYGFKVVITSEERSMEVCRCHSQTMAEKVSTALAITGTDDVQVLHLAGRSWLVYRSWGKPVAANTR